MLKSFTVSNLHQIKRGRVIQEVSS